MRVYSHAHTHTGTHTHTADGTVTLLNWISILNHHTVFPLVDKTLTWQYLIFSLRLYLWRWTCLIKSKERIWYTASCAQQTEHQYWCFCISANSDIHLTRFRPAWVKLSAVTYSDGHFSRSFYTCERVEKQKKQNTWRVVCDFGELCVCASLLIKDTQFEAFMLSAVFIMEQFLCWNVEKSPLNTGSSSTHCKQHLCCL